MKDIIGYTFSSKNKCGYCDTIVGRRALNAGTKNKKFEPDVFNAIVDHIVLGGVDDEGNKAPHLLTFVFKTGPKSKISMPKPKRGLR
ncbi:hypothetical protein [Vallitalea sediminicola]